MTIRATQQQHQNRVDELTYKPVIGHLWRMQHSHWLMMIALSHLTNMICLDRGILINETKLSRNFIDDVILKCKFKPNQMLFG